ncbi:cob(I)yrinic acid a,c-diamide adenosyltransferase [Candidatus Berkelbacteria bacterium]|nr:cob(I)yrinic acid a,c-diamide adenosyltransferase [Candidatus Berkelbacteria bacterium]
MSPSRLYTRRGDSGETSILAKVRLSKADPRLETIGTFDELNATLGLASTLIRTQSLAHQANQPDSHWSRDDLILWLTTIQSDLLSVGSYLAQPSPAEHSALVDQRIVELETIIDRLDAAAPPLQNFILPGGSVASAQLHVARAVCRRAERCLVRLCNELLIDPVVLRYCNRLSDLLFAAARATAHAAGATETIWKGHQ